jgi:tetratricopeptide (TPR) repeat protein
VGNVAAARACLEEARPIWREMGNLPMLCENLIGTAALLALAGKPEEALALYDEAYAISEEIGNPWGQAHSLFNAYLVDVEQGNVGRSMARMRECIQRSEEAGFLIPQSAARADLGVQYARLGQIERGVELADQGLEIAKRQTPLAVPMAMVSKAEILFLAGEPEQAESVIAQAELGRLPGPVRGAAGAHVDILRGQLAAARGDHVGAVEIADAVIAWLHGHELGQFLPAALLLKSRALIASERPEEADPLLREARSRAEEMGYRRLLWQIDRELSRLAADRGDATEAAALRAEAASIVSAITETIDDVELRASFLALPDVRAALSER